MAHYFVLYFTLTLFTLALCKKWVLSSCLLTYVALYCRIGDTIVCLKVYRRLCFVTNRVCRTRHFSDWTSGVWGLFGGWWWWMSYASTSMLGATCYQLLTKDSLTFLLILNFIRNSTLHIVSIVCDNRSKHCQKFLLGIQLPLINAFLTHSKEVLCFLVVLCCFMTTICWNFDNPLWQSFETQVLDS